MNWAERIAKARGTREWWLVHDRDGREFECFFWPPQDLLGVRKFYPGANVKENDERPV